MKNYVGRFFQTYKACAETKGPHIILRVMSYTLQSSKIGEFLLFENICTGKISENQYVYALVLKDDFFPMFG